MVDLTSWPVLKGLANCSSVLKPQKLINHLLSECRQKSQDRVQRLEVSQESRGDLREGKRQAGE